MLAEACHQLRAWQDRFGMALPVSVNLSARQLVEHGIVDDVARVLAASGVDPRDVVLEITETTLLEQTAGVIERLHGLKALGLRLAIDDFGMGYSSLVYLRGLPIDILKIDRSFVDGIAVSEKSSALAALIIDLGHSLRLQIVAEGIEAADQQGACRSWPAPWARASCMPRRCRRRRWRRCWPRLDATGRRPLPLGPPSGSASRRKLRRLSG